MRRHVFRSAIAILVLAGIALAEEVPKNIILLIGDGMGVSQLTAGKVAKGTLEMERLKIGGFQTTHADGVFVTDSAASATALACGVKTKNGMIGMTPDRKPVKNVREYAEDKGKSTGILSTCHCTHATPITFLAHSESRDNEAEMAEVLLTTDVEVIFCNEAPAFLPETVNGGKRKDGRDLFPELAKNMQVIRTKEEFDALKSDVGKVAGMFSGEGPTLAEMTKKTIDILSTNEKGFFLMVEGSRIDWMCHGTNLEAMISEVITFDDAVGVAMDFAEKDGNTLVLVTADHETAGFALHGGSVEKKEVKAAGWTSNGHTAAMVPVLSYGPGAQAFGGIQDNTDIGRKLIRYVGE